MTTTLEVFATGLRMGESPRWHGGRFWMCDWLAGEVLAFGADGAREVVTRVEGLPFSIDWLPDGRLVTTTPQGVVVGAELTPYGATGRPWNEIVVDAYGNVFVDMPGAMPWEDPKPGVLAVVSPDGGSRDLVGELWFPNGMAITDDGSTLIVAESHAQRLTAFDLDHDGSVANRRVWATLGDCPPDGICLDAAGAVWYADVAHGHCRRVGEGGAVLQTIDVGQSCFACILGGDDGRTLYIVANDYSAQGCSNGRVLTARVDVPRAGRP